MWGIDCQYNEVRGRLKLGLGDDRWKQVRMRIVGWWVIGVKQKKREKKKGRWSQGESEMAVVKTEAGRL